MEGQPMIVRLNWGCGEVLPPDWTNSDECGYANGPPNHLGRIQDGLPWAAGFFDYVVSHHSLMMLPEPDLIPALAELRRVTKPGGWLRVSVPDIWSAFWACRAEDQGWFPVEADDTDEAFCRYITQNGATRSVFTHNRLVRLIEKAGWTGVRGSSWKATWSDIDGICDLDSRPGESLWVEAVNSL